MPSLIKIRQGVNDKEVIKEVKVKEKQEFVREFEP